MKWTKRIPKIEGYYWFSGVIYYSGGISSGALVAKVFNRWGSLWAAMHINFHGLIMSPCSALTGEWYGPLILPKENT